jgi:hypothetical protein
MRWTRDEDLDLWWGSDGSSQPTGDTTVLPWGEQPDREQAKRLARLVDVDVPDRWLHPDNWVTELYDQEVHPAAVPPTERVGRAPAAPPADRVIRAGLYPSAGLPPVPPLPTGRVSAPFPTYPAGAYWPGWEAVQSPLGRWMDELRPPRTANLQVDPAQVGAPRWAPPCSELRLEMPRLRCWAALGQAHGAWVAVAEDRLLFGGFTPPDEPPWPELYTGRQRRSPRWYTARKVVSTADPLPDRVEYGGGLVLLGQVLFDWVQCVEARFTYNVGWTRAVLRTHYGRPEKRHVGLWFHNGWDAVCLSFQLPTDPPRLVPGAADDYDSAVGETIGQLARDIAEHRLANSPPSDPAQAETLRMCVAQGLALPAPPPLGPKSGKLAVRRGGCELPGASMMSLPQPDWSSQT